MELYMHIHDLLQRHYFGPLDAAAAMHRDSNTVCPVQQGIENYQRDYVTRSAAIQGTNATSVALQRVVHQQALIRTPILNEVPVYSRSGYAMAVAEAIGKRNSLATSFLRY